MSTKRIAMKVLLSFFVAALAISVYAGAESVPVATAQLPFDFFADGERMQAGEYTITYNSDIGALFLRNKATRAAKQTFMARSRDPVATDDATLVFVLFKQQYRLVGFRSGGRTYRITEYIFDKLPEGASLHEILVTYLVGKK
jgi:hypothetical protein